MSNQKTYHSFLCAGLGNRLFQYASIKGISKLHNVQFNIIGQETVREHNNNTYQWFMDLISFSKYISTDWANIKAHFLKNNMDVYEQHQYEHIGYHQIDLSRLNNKEHTLFLGFFQCERYFENIADELREELKEPEYITPQLNAYLDKLQLQNIDYKNCCIVHVRLKDKLIDSRHYVHYGKYYTKAIKQVREKNPETMFLILSETPDDIKYVYPTLLSDLGTIDKDYIIIPRTFDNLECFDLYLLTRIPTIISTCSTFVWWGAWLNPNPEKQLYLPSHFLNDPINHRVDMKGAIIIDVK
jgi:hypothetical protein